MTDFTQRNDLLLQPYLEASDESDAQQKLAALIQDYAEPIVTKILKTKLRVSMNGANGSQSNQDALEIASSLCMTLIHDLRVLQKNPDKQIASFSDYVAVKAYSACADYFRQLNPNRWRLKNALRYQLKNNARYALWKAEDNRWYAGFAESRTKASVAGEDFRDAEDVVSERKYSNDEFRVTTLLPVLLAASDTPIEFDRLVTLAAEELGIRDAPSDSLESLSQAAVNNSEAPINIRLEQRFFLQRLWHEACDLPILQRAALLLNLRDANGGGAIFFLPLLSIASREQIAGTLEIPCERFDAIWTNLPMEDAQIAEMYSLTRQQVINLRKTARERLKRRLEK